jgi:hypothetical protein
MEIVETAAARIWLDEDGIVRYVSRGVVSTAQSVDEGMQAVKKITGGRRVPILFDARNWPKGDPSSWVRFISMVETHCLAAAVLVNETSTKALGRFPEFIDDLVIPFRLFEEEDAALEFLRSHA